MYEGTINNIINPIFNIFIYLFKLIFKIKIIKCSLQIVCYFKHLQDSYYSFFWFIKLGTVNFFI